MDRAWSTSISLVSILLLGLILRLAPWGYNRFLEDEALYAYWGLQIASGADPMLDYEPVDKPPLHPYVLALSFLLFGQISPSQSDVSGLTAHLHQNETAARLPSLFASVTGIALIYALALKLYGDRTVGLLAALLLALSPFDLLFASTVFTDPLMTALVLAALLAAAAGKPGTAGVLIALAAATKQQALFFLPLVVVIGLLGSAEERTPRRWVWFVLGFAAVAAGVIGWDLAREQRPGFFLQSLISYGGLEPALPKTLGVRAIEWLQRMGDFWVSPWFNGLLVIGLISWLVGGFARWWPGWTRIDLALGGFVVFFLAVHWLIGFQIWARYLLGLVPLVALLAARAFVTLGRGFRVASWRRAYAIVLGLVLVLALGGPVLQATRSELPLGGDHGAYDGLDDLASYLHTQAPPGSVLYHYWLGYHYHFYLYGMPIRLHWYPELQDLAQDAYVYRREPRYIAFPSWRDGRPAEEALTSVGARLVPVFETTRRDGTVSFRLYRLEGP
jgi:4-amino-4-deoxy-L-arabinose transferase-like glycosyltransferase